MTRQLPGGLAALLLAKIPAGSAAAAALDPDPAEDLLAFRVTRAGTPIGHHILTFRQQGSRLMVTAEIRLQVRIAFVTVFRYAHDNLEVWRDGRLESLQSSTDDDGRHFEVAVERRGETLQMTSATEGQAELPGDMLTTSYWNPAAVERDALIDTQRGRVARLSGHPLGYETIEAEGRRLEAARYRVRGDLDIDIWYDGDGRWAKLAFQARGSEILYERVSGTAGEVPA